MTIGINTRGKLSWSDLSSTKRTWGTERSSPKPFGFVKQGYVNLGNCWWPCFLLSGGSQSERMKEKNREHQWWKEERKEGRQGKKWRNWWTSRIQTQFLLVPETYPSQVLSRDLKKKMLLFSKTSLSWILAFAATRSLNNEWSLVNLNVHELRREHEFPSSKHIREGSGWW